MAKFQVVQRMEKVGRNRRKGKVTGLEETKKKERKKKEKTKQDGGDGCSVDRRKAASAAFAAGAPYLIRAASDVKGRENELGPASGRRCTRLLRLVSFFLSFSFLFFCLFQTCHLPLPSVSSDLFHSLYYLERQRFLDVLMINHQTNVALFGISRSILHQSRANLPRRMCFSSTSPISVFVSPSTRQRSCTTAFTSSAHVRRQSLPVWPPTLNNYLYLYLSACNQKAKEKRKPPCA